jgi:hypothetical protein
VILNLLSIFSSINRIDSFLNYLKTIKDKRAIKVKTFQINRMKISNIYIVIKSITAIHT